MTAHRYFLPSFGSFGKAVSEEKIFRNRPIREKNCRWQPYLLMDRDEMSNIYRGPPIDASYQVAVHSAKRFQRRRFYRNQPIRNKNCLWQPCLLTDRDEMSNCNRWHSIDASYQVSVHLPIVIHRCFLPSFGSFAQTISEEKNLKNQPIRNKNRLWRPCL